MPSKFLLHQEGKFLLISRGTVDEGDDSSHFMVNYVDKIEDKVTKLSGGALSLY